MALIGGGGAGNVAGSNPSGTGSSINYVGEHAYANSGIVAVNNSETILLDFTTQNSYILAKVQFNLLADTADDMFYRVKINSEVTNGYLTQGAQQSTDSNNVIPLFIPPYSRIIMTATNAGSSTNRDNICVVVGRVYA
jgi:hypothetical protein